MTSIQRGFCVGMKVRHFKGAYYEIVGFALNTETNEKMVVYKRLYPPCLLFVRPEEMFCSEVDHKKYPNAKQKYRFECAEDESKILEQESCEDAISREAMLNYQQYLHGRMSNEENHKLWEFIKDLPSVTPVPKKCHNVNPDYAECDQFVCSNCGIELQDWHRVERDEDDGDITYHEYEFNYCPNCGAKIDKHTLKYADEDTLMPAT